MLRLDKIPAAPYWLDMHLGGLRLKVRPPSTALNAQAFDAASRAIARLALEVADRKSVGTGDGDLPDFDDESVRAGYAKQAHAVALGQAAILDWQGVADENGPIVATPDHIAALMRIEPVGANFVLRYLASLDALVIEGNGSGAAPNGTGGAAPATAPAAASTEPPALAAA